MSKPKIFKVLDDRINVDSPKILVTEDGPNSSTYQSVLPSDPTSLNPTFSIQTPSVATGINRKMYWRMAGSLVITGTNMTNLTAENRIAFRQFPLQQCCSSVQVQVNDSTMSIGNLSQIISGILRKGLTSKSMAQGLSDTNARPDAVNNYRYAMGADGIFNAPGQSAYSDYSDPSRCKGITAVTFDSATQVTVSFDIVEPIVVPPFEYGDDAHTKSIFGVHTLQVTCNMSNVHRALSIALGGTTSTVSAVSLSPTAQSLLVGFVTPKDTSIMHSLDRDYLYGFTNVQSFFTTITSGAVTSGSSVSGSSNSIDLPVVPKGFIVYATYSETDRSNASLSDPDLMLPITSIQCQFMTRSGLLAGATRDQLYQLNVKNGVTGPAWQWRGDRLVSAAGGSPYARGSGNILYIDCAQDLSLPDGIHPGMMMKSQFSVDSVTVTNNAGKTLTAPRLVIIALTDGILRNKDGASMVSLGNIPQGLDLKDATPIMKSELMALSAEGGYGGGFFDFLKKVGKVARHFITPVTALIAPEAVPIAAAVQKAVGGKKQKQKQKQHKLEQLLM